MVCYHINSLVSSLRYRGVLEEHCIVGLIICLWCAGGSCQVGSSDTFLGQSRSREELGRRGKLEVGRGSWVNNR